MSGCKCVVKLENLNKLDENKYYRPSELRDIIGVIISWPSYATSKYGLPYKETNKSSGSGMNRRIYLGKDVVDCVMAHCNVVEKVAKNTANRFFPAEVVIPEKKSNTGFMCMINGEGVSLQGLGGDTITFTSKWQAMMNIAARLGVA